MPAGRPKVINEWEESPERINAIKGWAMSGLTKEQIASNIGISTKTLYEWIKKYSNICEALKKSREVADYQTVNSLFQNANGFEYFEEVAIKIKETGFDDNGRKWEKEKVEKVKVKKVKLPETMAQMYWLNNKLKNDWKQRQEVDINNYDQLPKPEIIIDVKTDE